ncbi:MAG TPA: cytochrome c oxidase subunit I [Chloroflexota bacterium]|nr:cytochrome c oxidase subunit I [Chloroflexota bacterium]
MSSTADSLRGRNWDDSGIWSWITTTNHKRIGVLYLTTSFVFFLAAAAMAMLMRTQLIKPDNDFLSPDVYNQIFTMHGTTMVFLFGMPVLAGFGNYIVPLMIGARDMVFPRLNAFSYWTYLAGAILLYSSFVFGGAPNAGWFSYAPLTEMTYSQTAGMDYWSLSIIMLGMSSIAGAVNIFVTILTLRAPGMGFNRMPLFVWATFVNQFIILVALPSLTAAAIMLYLDRHYGTSFFNPATGGDPLLWQHLFWFFGHPEVYILILPAFGIISEVIPVFARKPIFGYSFIAYSSVAIGILSFAVWAHHMFAVGMSLAADAVFAFTSFTIAVPTAVKIFNWLATLWGGALRLKTPLLFAMGFIGLFVIGGLSGMAVAVVPFDWQVTDSYFVVGHLHSVLFGGTAFGVFAGIYYWFPKITGRMMDERLGVLSFALLVVGFLFTFQPFHILGLLGMPRRIYTFAGNMGWNELNLIGTLGAYVIAVAAVVFLWNLMASLRNGRVAGPDPWDAWTLEWATSSPPPVHNFDRMPEVRSRRPLWDEKHPERADYLVRH